MKICCILSTIHMQQSLYLFSKFKINKISNLMFIYQLVCFIYPISSVISKLSGNLHLCLWKVDLKSELMIWTQLQLVLQSIRFMREFVAIGTTISCLPMSGNQIFDTKDYIYINMLIIKFPLTEPVLYMSDAFICACLRQK